VICVKVVYLLGSRDIRLRKAMKTDEPSEMLLPKR
jgi:hypothetical protein